MGIRRDLLYAIRSLSRAPAFTLPAVASLALGIAINTTMFSVVNSVLLRPLGSFGTSDLVRIGRSTVGEEQFRSSSYDEFTYLREHASSLASLAGHQLEPLIMDGPDDSQVVSAEIVAGDYFSVLGVPPILGRGFVAEYGVPGEDPVVVISDRFWRSQFGADPVISGRTASLNNVQFTIVGVGPPGFIGTFPGVSVDLWLPVSMTDALRPRANRRVSMDLIGHLKEGV